MKPTIRLRSFLLGSTLLAAAPFARAVSGNWAVDNLGNWSLATNWSSNPTVPGTAAGDTIGFTNNITGNRVVTIDTTSRTAGILNIGDSNNTHRFTLAASGGGALTLNNNGSAAQINETGFISASVFDTISTNITLADNLAVSATGELHITGIIGQTGGARTITKTGVGLVNLTNANTFTGVVNVNEGTLGYQNATAGGTTAGNTIVASGATAYITTQLPTGFAEAFNITGTGVGGNGALRIGGGGITNFGGSVTLSGDSRIGTDGGATANFNAGIDTAGFTLTLAPTGPGLNVATTAISGTGAINKVTTAAVAFNVASTYSGGTTVSAGTLTLGNTAALGATSGQLTVNTGGTLNLAGNSITVGNLTGTGGVISGTAAGTRTLTIGDGNTGGGNFLGAINNGTGGTTALTKTGSGTIKLGSTSGYNGATAVSGGTLVINGNISTSSSTTVSNGATLAGTGTVGVTTIQSTGILAPGDGGIESLNTGALTLSSGSFSNFEINTAGDIADLAISSALLTFGGTLNVTNIGGTLLLNDTFNLFDWGTTTGTFSTVNLPTLTGGLNWDTGNLYTAGTIVVVPEPNVAALLGGLGMIALLRRRR